MSNFFTLAFAFVGFASATAVCLCVLCYKVNRDQQYWEQHRKIE